MRSFFQSRRAFLALSANVAVLLLILLAVFAREGRSFGQMQMTPPSPAGGLTVMPAQLSPNTWGCYVMDSQNQTLSVYVFSPGGPELKLAAGRDIRYDRKLGFFNTSPSPTEIRKLIERAEEPPRMAPTTNRSPESAPQ